MKYAGIDSWLKKADFDRANASVVSPLTEGFVYSRAMYNDNGIASEIEYKYLVSGEEVFNSLARSFYDAGFNKDYDANVVDFEELLYSQFEGQKMFNGAIAEGDYRDFIIELELLAPYYDGGDYTLEITYYNNKE